MTHADITSLGTQLSTFYKYYKSSSYSRRKQHLHVCLPVFHPLLHIVSMIEVSWLRYMTSQWSMKHSYGVFASLVASTLDTNCNLELTPLLLEQRNHLPYVIPNKGDRNNDNEDVDGQIQVHKLLVHLVSDDRAVNPPSLTRKSMKKDLFRLVGPSKVYKLGRWEKYCLTHLIEGTRILHDEYDSNDSSDKDNMQFDRLQ